MLTAGSSEVTRGLFPHAVESSPHLPARAARQRLGDLFARYFDFAWRSLRRLGVDPSGVDDAVQQLFIVVADKLDEIDPRRERSFVFGTAVRIAADHRRHARFVAARHSLQGAEALPTLQPSAEDLLDEKRRREMLDRLLEGLPMELRTVLVLVHGEGMTMAEVADLLEIPPGTVASRLRRARAALKDSIGPTRENGAEPERRELP
jgi:RNA polymerase sigma-70 factor, ECF subfamily